MERDEGNEVLRMASPLGPLEVVAAESGVQAVRFVESEQETEPRTAVGRRAVERLRAYFDGQMDALEELPLEVSGTEFQHAVWKALRAIRPGHTIAYRELAAEIGRPDSVRAVGGAVGANPVPIVVPCHRVVQADGHLGGYVGGVERKAWLLRHEGALEAPDSGAPAGLPF
jgi:methylated-DNA-[protein]-cysteine S-methyltransferase